MHQAISLPAHPFVRLLPLYQAQLRAGWQADAAQAQVVPRLQSLSNALYGALGRAPRGVWLYGPSGRGKTALLQVFVRSMATFPGLRYVPMHAFLNQVYARLEDYPRAADPVRQLAHAIHAETSVLVLDDLYLANVQDALLLSRLLPQLMDLGTVLVVGSNWAPEGIGQGPGLSAERFGPLVSALRAGLEVHDLGLGPDYRRRRRPSEKLYVCTRAGESDTAQLTVLFEAFATGPNRRVPEWLFPRRAQGGAVWLTFAEACEKPWGRAEYTHLANTFATVVVEGIPQLKAADAPAAFRLAQMVDILYQHRRRLVVSAAMPSGVLCREGPAAQLWARTASRLLEMTGG